MITGISDNPPGLVLCLLSSLFLIFAFTHNWRVPRNYILLLVFSIFGFMIFAVLHNVLEMAGSGNIPDIFGAVFFIAAIFICPAGLIIGLAGIILTSIKKKNPIK